MSAEPDTRTFGLDPEKSERLIAKFRAMPAWQLATILPPERLQA
jgi:hypothetical protein